VRRVIAILLASLVVVGPWSTALAQEEGTVEEGTEVEEPSFAPGSEPAIILEVESEDAKDVAWTFRYLVPTLLALGVVVLLAVILHYGFRVRGRYRVVR
jgi:hypothetical protein